MATLEYDFKVVGLDAVSKAFASLERRAKTHNDKMARMFADANGAPGAPPGRRGRGGPVAGGAGGATPRSRDPIEQQRRDNAKLRNQQQKDDARALNDETKRHNNWLRQRAKWHEDEIKQEKRKEDTITKETRKAKKERERILQAQSAQRQQVRRAVIGGVAGAVTSLGQKAVAGATVGAGSYIAAGLNAGRNAYRESTALAAQSKQAGNIASLKDINKDILESSGKTAQAYGVSRADVIRQMSAFHGVAGNLDVAKRLSGYMTTFAESANANPEDVGKLAGRAFEAATRKGMSPAEAEEATKKIMGTFMAHAAKGTIEMSDYAAVAPEILAAAGRTGSSEMFTKTAGLASFIAQQSPGGGAVSAPEAATATARLVDALTENAPKIKQLTGVETMFTDPKTGIKKLKGFEETLPALFAATNADPEMLKKMGIDVRANRAFQGLTDIYAAGKQRIGPGSDREKGAQALREAMDKTFSEGTTEAQIKEMAEFRKEEDPYAKLEAALTKLADNAIPPLTEAMTSFTTWLNQHKEGINKTGEFLGETTKFVGENPVTSAGIVGGAAITFAAIKAYVGAKVAALAAGTTAAEAVAATGAAEAGVAGAGATATAAGATGLGLAPLVAATVATMTAGYGAYKGFQFGQENKTGNAVADFLVGGYATNIGALLGPLLLGKTIADSFSSNSAASPVGGGTGGPIGAPQAGQAAQASQADVLKAAASAAFVPASQALVSAAVALTNSAGALVNRGDAPGQPVASAGGRK
jgi:hypothetical protein